LSTQVTKTEAAVVSAAIFAYLSKPEAAPTAESPTKPPAETSRMPDDFSKEFRSELAKQLNEAVLRLERRLDSLERAVNVIRAKVEMLEKAGLTVERPLKPAGSVWSLAGRAEFAKRKDTLTWASGSSSLWSLSGRYREKLPSRVKRE
jgi:exonuclease VII small subunit